MHSDMGIERITILFVIFYCLSLLVTIYASIIFLCILIHKYALNILLNILLKIIVPNILCTYWRLHKPHPVTLSFYNPEPLAFMCFQSQGFDTSVSPRRINNNFPKKKKIQKTFQKKNPENQKSLRRSQIPSQLFT